MKGMSSGGGVVAMGSLLVVCGLYGMWAGWDQILIERGWASFIAGATAISGGVVTIALGRVIAALKVAQPVRHETREGPPAANQARAETPAQPVQSVQRIGPEETPLEIDRYIAGDVVYAIFTDGSIEVRKGDSAERYASLNALRDKAERRN